MGTILQPVSLAKAFDEPCSFAWIGALHALHADSRPNIVWIYSDDHTNKAIRAYGGRLAEFDPPPNIDSLATKGLRFDKSYVGNFICAPARATLLAGKDSHMHGKFDNRGSLITTSSNFKKYFRKTAIKRR